jgi:protein TonB
MEHERHGHANATVDARPISMFHGFDPATRDQVFARRNKRSLLIAALSYAVLFGSWVALDRSKEPAVEVQFEPEIKDFAIEEEPEPEPEEEPPPPPPELQPKPQVQKPKPKPKPEVPKVIPDAPPPEQDKPADDKAFGTGPAGTGTGPAKPKLEKKPEVKKPDPPKPAPPKPAAEPIDPTKPVDRPEKASVPQADAGNKAPDYPKDLRDAGVEGEVVIKLHVHRDGTVKGAKILRSTNSATGEEEKAAADKAFKAAVIAAIKAWKYTPSKLDGQPISVWIIVNFPFKLTAG